ncbi:MAG: hypothetical protein QF704_12020, partial [Anaerolineales bacterium]|nr:hypothetical protein [Anaerolineales bacterium]
SGHWDNYSRCGATSYAIEYGQWFNVCETCEYKTIQEAVDDASNTETIYVGEGIYTSVDGNFLVDLQGKNISIVGAGSSMTILEAHHAVRGLQYELVNSKTIKIEGVTIQNCVGGNGAAISIDDGTIKIYDSSFIGNQSIEADTSGGAIQASGSANILIDGCDLSNNYSVKYGGAICLVGNNTTAQITDSLFSNNESYYGGAVYVSDGSKLSADLLEFSNNTSAVDGGAVSIVGDETSFTSCCFSDNFAGGLGGAVDNRSVENTLFSDSLFANNLSVYEGGALYNKNNNALIDDCTFASNTSYEENGGGIHNDNSTPSIEGTLFCGNTGRDNPQSTLEGHIFPNVADLDYEYVGGNEFHELCTTCQGDVNGDGVVDLADLLAIAMLSVWGECDDCLADLDNNGVVDPDDIVILIELLVSRLDHPCAIECPYRY